MPDWREIYARHTAATMVVAMLAAALAGSAGTLAVWNLALNKLPQGGAATSPAAATPTVPAPSTGPSAVRSLTGKIGISIAGLQPNCGPQGAGAGWVVFPGGRFELDTNTDPTVSCVSTYTFDQKQQRWLGDCVPFRKVGPTYYCSAKAVLADGSSYFMPRFTPYSYGVVGAEPEGLYVIFNSWPGGPDSQSQGLMYVDYSGLNTHYVIETGFWSAAAYGYAYGTLTRSVPDGAGNVLRRLDLKTGQAGDWFTRPGLVSKVIGFTTEGIPIVFASSPERSEVWLVAPAPQLLFSGSADFTTTSAGGDSIGIWVASNRGLFLYTQTAGWELASDTVGQLASTFIAAPA